MAGAAPSGSQAYNKSESTAQSTPIINMCCHVSVSLIGQLAARPVADAALSSNGVSLLAHTLDVWLLGFAGGSVACDFRALTSPPDCRAAPGYALQINQFCCGASVNTWAGYVRWIGLNDDVISLVSMLFDFHLDDPNCPALRP